MNRKEFVELCQLASAVDYKGVPERCLVKYEGIKYLPYGYELRFALGMPIHNAILKDLNANAIIYAKMESVQANV